MWHKVHPISFRIPYIKTWSSSWYAGRKDYATQLAVDTKIRNALVVELNGIPVWDILIARSQDSLIVDIFTAKASLVLGKDDANRFKITSLLEKISQMKVVLNVKEIKKPETNAKIVWFMISNQIEKRMPYKRAIKQAIKQAMEKGAKWIKVKVWGRLNWAEIARKETFKDGNIPTQTIRANIDYSSVRAETIYWTIGLKVWIYKWDVYKK